MKSNEAGEFVFWQSTMGDTNRVPVYKPRTVARKSMDANYVWMVIVSLAFLLTSIGAQALVQYLKH